MGESPKEVRTVANVGEMEIPVSVRAVEEELPILDRIARLEASRLEEQERRHEWEKIVDGRLSRIERAIGLDDRPHLVQTARY
jgi:hypothetical protein